MKKKTQKGPGGQAPDPKWAEELADGDLEKAQDLGKKIDGLAESFGGEAADDCRAEMKRIIGKAMLRRAERDNPHWDGKTKIVP